MSEPLHQLLCKDTQQQQRAFEQIKKTLTSAEVLACYDSSRPTIIAADASLNGIGAVPLQVQDDGNRRPISYASRALGDAEKRYAIIEKDALAGVWACEKFSEYVVGMNFVLETDHKPLQTLINTTGLSKTPPPPPTYPTVSPSVNEIQRHCQICPWETPINSGRTLPCTYRKPWRKGRTVLWTS